MRRETGEALLASSPHYAHQAFRVGSCVYGVQFHIETTPEIIDEWVEEDREGVESSPWDGETIKERSRAAHPAVEEAWQPFAVRFADLVRSRAVQAA